MKGRQVMLGAAVFAVALASLPATGASATLSQGDRWPGNGSGDQAQDAAIVTQWNLIAQTQTIPLRPSAHGQARGIAMVEGAVFDAVNAIDRSYEPYLLDLDSMSFHRYGSQGAAAATAAYRVLLAITPTTSHPGLEAAYQTTLAPIAEPAKQAGIDAGEAAAAAMLAFREGDGFMAAFTPTIGTDAGDWRPLGWPTTPIYDPDGWVANLKPFVISDPAQFRSDGPNDLRSRAYARDFAEVKELGALNSPTRTPDQTAAAVFWQFPPIALWNGVGRDLATRYDLDAVEQARFFAMFNLAAADGATSCWNDKYHWNFWRPTAAVREADTDGNRRTIADPTWEPLFSAATQTTPPLTTPPFPDHPSGHGCVSGATATAMADFFGRNRIEFTVTSGRTLNGAPIPPRTFQSFSDVIDEIIDARVWGGIHFRTADEQGARIGRQVARYMDRHYFQQARWHGDHWDQD